MAVLAIATSKDEEFLIFATNKDNCKVSINLLKVQSKSESQQTIRIIEKFA